jgi:hypothetical protein
VVADAVGEVFRLAGAELIDLLPVDFAAIETL